MNKEKHFEQWKESKRNIEVTWSFKQNVINEVHRFQHGKKQSWGYLGKIVNLLYENRLAKSGLIAVSAAAGVIRMAFIVYIFLG